MKPLEEQMAKKEVLAWSILIFLFCAGLYLFGEYRKTVSHPNFLLPKLEALMDDTRLMDSIGGSHDFELQFNVIDFHSKDTLRTTIRIAGSKRTLQYNAIHRRTSRGENNWELINDDMVIQ